MGDDFDSKDILVNDFMYPAWDITNQRPAFFNLAVAEHELKEDPNS